MLYNKFKIRVLLGGVGNGRYFQNGDIRESRDRQIRRQREWRLEYGVEINYLNGIYYIEKYLRIVNFQISIEVFRDIFIGLLSFFFQGLFFIIVQGIKFVFYKCRKDQR